MEAIKLEDYEIDVLIQGFPGRMVCHGGLGWSTIALIRGRATGNGSEITLACDMAFASKEKAIISQWEVGVGMVAGGGPMAPVAPTHRPQSRRRKRRRCSPPPTGCHRAAGSSRTNWPTNCRIAALTSSG